MTVALIIGLAFGILTEITLARPEHNTYVEQRNEKIKEDRKSRSMQVVIYDRMDKVDGHYVPIRDTIYILTEL